MLTGTSYYCKYHSIKPGIYWKLIHFNENCHLLWVWISFLAPTMDMWNEGLEPDSNVNGSWTVNSGLNLGMWLEMWNWGVMLPSGVLPFGSSHRFPKQGDFAATPGGESGIGNTINKSNRADTRQKSSVYSRNRNMSAKALKSIKSYRDQMKTQPCFHMLSTHRS